MPIPIAALAAIPGLLSAGYKTFAGIKQTRDGKEMAANNIFHKYNRPGEVNQALALAEQKYRNGSMPGSGLLNDRIATSAAGAFDASMQGASSGGDVLDAASKINFNTNTAMNDLALQDAQYQDKALADYTNQLNNSAKYADKEFQYNVAEPYERTAAAASAMIGAGNVNTFNGIDEGMGSVAAGISAFDEGGTMGEMMGNPNVTKAGFAPPTVTAEPSKSFSNPSLMGRWIVDPATGAKRWAAN